MIIWLGPATNETGPSLSSAGKTVWVTRPWASWMRTVRPGP